MTFDYVYNAFILCLKKRFSVLMEEIANIDILVNF